MKIYDMAVIGGGPSGYSAALYAARAGLSTLVVEKLSAGGQMALTHEIDNYPGFEEGIDGWELGEKMQQQAERFGAVTELVHVTALDLTGDIKEAKTLFAKASFQVITSNPPYMIAEHGLKNEADAKTIARHEVLCTLDDLLIQSARILKPNGRFYMVHRPFRLAEIFSKMVAYGIEPKRMQLVYPNLNKEPNMVLIEGYRGGKSRITIEKPLIVYKEDGGYTDEILSIYGMLNQD